MATPAAVLQILVTADTDRARRQVADLDRSLGSADKSGSRMGSTMKKVGAVVGGIVAFDTLRRGVGAAVSEFEEARKVGAQTEAVIKSTGGAAGVTAKHVANLAGAISKKVGIDDEAIQSGANLLLTFKNVRNEVGRGNKVFDRATKAAVDLSAAGFGDLSATSKQLGKALNDPIKGLTALGRSGVTFTQQQQEKIKSLVEEGKTLKAQKIILKEVESQVKGSAAAQATSLDKAKVALGNLAEAGGAVLVPALDKAAAFMATLINQMIEGKSTGGAIISVFKGFGSVVGTVAAAIAGLIGWFKQHETVALALAAAVGVLVTAFAAMKILAVVQAAVVALQVAMVALNAAFLTNPVFLLVAALAALAAGVVVAYRESETFRGIVDAAWATIKTVAAWLITAGVVAFAAIKTAVVDAWTTIRSVTDTVWGAIDVYVKAIWTGLKAAATIYFTAYKTIILTAWQVIKTVTETVWAAIKLVATTAWTVLKTAAAVTWELIRLAILTPIRGARDSLVTIWETIRTVATGAWGLLRAAAATGWDLIRDAILAPIRAARDVLGGKDGIWSQIKEVASKAWDGIKGAIKDAADPILDVILAPFKAAVKGVAKFAKLILEVVGKIPGVDTSGPVKAIDKFTEGLAKGGVYKGFARGGAFARTGGVVSAPITLMGEEAPRHPEFVIPTNPAYRKRAQGLLGRAAKAVGFAKGGQYDRDYGAGNMATIPFEAAAQLAEAAGLPGITYAQIAIGESSLRPGAVSADGGHGLWQMTPRVQSAATVARWNQIGSYYNPWNNAQMAKVLAGSGTGVSNYYGTGHVTDWNAHYKGSVKGYETNIPKADGIHLNPMELIKKLPGVGDIPEWLGGMGKWVLEKVSKFIKDNVGSALLGKTVGNVQKAIMLATSMGHPTPTGNQVYRNYGGTLHQAGKAVDFGDAGQSIEKMLKLFNALYRTFGSSINELFYDINPWYIDGGRRVNGQFGGHLDHIHVGFFRRGGKYGGVPFVGSYAQGGVVPATGMAMVHRGETITPAGGMPEVHVYIGDTELKDMVRVEIVERDRHAAARFGAGLVTT